MDMCYSLAELCEEVIIQNYMKYRYRLKYLPADLRESVNRKYVRRNRYYQIVSQDISEYWRDFYTNCPCLYSYETPSRYSKNGCRYTYEFHYVYLVHLRNFGYSFIQVSFICARETRNLIEFAVNYTIDQFQYYHLLRRIDYLLDWPLTRPWSVFNNKLEILQTNNPYL